MKTCSVNGCEKKRKKDHGKCSMHCARIERYGSTELPKRKTTKEKFESKIEMIPECGCWIWIGGCCSGGYGTFGFKGKIISAHRMAWIIYNEIIPDGLWILHRCDTPSCVNPNHLFLGTRADNMRDCINKKRLNTPRGEKNWNAKLTEDSVIKIRVDKRSHRIIAKDYLVSHFVIGSIKRGKMWKHI